MSGSIEKLLAISQAHSLRDHLTSLERSAIDAHRRRFETILGFDPVRQAERFWRNDPATQAQRSLDEKRRLFESLNPSARHFDERLRLHGTLEDSAARIKREMFAPPLMPRPLPDFKPARDLHLEALTDIRRSLRSKAQQKAEGVHAGIVDEIRQQQADLREDQQLLVYCVSGGERFQVLRIKVPPSHFTIILEGIDAEGNPGSRIAPVSNVEITTKVMNLAPPAKPYRIGFVMPTDHETD